MSVDLQLVCTCQVVSVMTLYEATETGDKRLNKLIRSIDQSDPVMKAERDRHPVTRSRRRLLMAEYQGIFVHLPLADVDRQRKHPADVGERLENLAHHSPSKDGVVALTGPWIARKLELVRFEVFAGVLNSSWPGGVDSTTDGVDFSRGKAEEAEAVLVVHGY